MIEMGYPHDLGTPHDCYPNISHIIYIWYPQYMLIIIYGIPIWYPHIYTSVIPGTRSLEAQSGRDFSGDFYAAVGGDRLVLIAGKMLKIYDLTVHSGAGQI